MALEPRVIAPDEAPNEELADMTRRFWIGALLGLPVVLLAMADLVIGPAVCSVRCGRPPQ
jgi:Cu+-exporting ATPase